MNYIKYQLEIVHAAINRKILNKAQPKSVINVVLMIIVIQQIV